jgi:serine/threonine protein kinase
MTQLASAVTYLHSLSIAHCDLKLENILIDNNIKTAKIIDFGLAIEKRTFVDDVCLGTPSYMSPQLLSKDSFNPFKADVWALGVMYYKIVFGFLPFKGKTPELILKKINTLGVTFPKTKKIPRKIQEVLERTLTIKESARASAEEIYNIIKN